MPVTEFDAELFYATVDKVTMKTEQEVAVQFREGKEVNVDASKTLKARTLLAVCNQHYPTYYKRYAAA